MLGEGLIFGEGTWVWSVQFSFIHITQDQHNHKIHWTGGKKKGI